MTSWISKIIERKIKSNNWFTISIYGNQVDNIIEALINEFRPSMIITNKPFLTHIRDEIFILEINPHNIIDRKRELIQIIKNIENINATFYYIPYISFHLKFNIIPQSYAALYRIILSEITLLRTLIQMKGVKKLIVIFPSKYIYINSDLIPIPLYKKVITLISDAIFLIMKNRLIQIKPKLISYIDGEEHLSNTYELKIYDILLRDWFITYT